MDCHTQEIRTILKLTKTSCEMYRTALYFLISNVDLWFCYEKTDLTVHNFQNISNEITRF